MSTTVLIDWDKAVNNERCPHYAFKVAQVIVPGHYWPMHLPVYCCGLSEVMIERLGAHSEGRRVATALQTIAADNINRPHSGPDFKPLHPLACTVERFEECKKHFTEYLTAYGQETSLPAQRHAEHVPGRRERKTD